MLVSRSALENPRPFDRCSRTSSPSSTSTRRPPVRSSSATIAAIVLLPAPDNPVNHRQKPGPSCLTAGDRSGPGGGTPQTWGGGGRAGDKRGGGLEHSGSRR